MSTTKSHGPVGYITAESLRVLRDGGFGSRALVPLHASADRIATVGLVTAEDMEAYAAARVKEALDEAAQACEARIGQHSPGMKPEDVEDCDEEARECAAAIRDLITK